MRLVVLDFSVCLYLSYATRIENLECRGSVKILLKYNLLYQNNYS